MPWNSDGGDGDKNNPWGNRPSQQPHDIEEALRKSREQFKRTFTKNFGTGGGLWIIFAAIAALWAMSGFYFLDEREEAVVLRFGKFKEITGAGIHYHLPYPVESKIVKRVTDVINFNSSKALMVTGDENIVNAGFTVQYYIKNLEQYLLKARNPDETVRIGAISVVREVMAHSNAHEAISTARDSIAQQVKVELQKLIDEYDLGIRIVRVDLQSVDPPAPVRDAYLDVQRAVTDKETSINEAEAYKNKVLEAAAGQAARVREVSEAYKAERLEKARGEAGEFNKVYESYKAAPDVTKKRMYLETMEEVLEKADKIILDKESGVLPYTTLPSLLNKKKGA